MVVVQKKTDIRFLQDTVYNNLNSKLLLLIYF